MRRRTKGQSLVEMALLLPLMLVVLFGIIDFGWYIYSYATIYMSARDGAEKASQVPPMPSKLAPLNSTDTCVFNVLREIQQNAIFVPDLTTHNPSYVTISYPTTRALGEQIEIKIAYELQPLTPLWGFVPIGQKGKIPITVVTRRSIESLGNNPNSPNLVACN